MNLEGKKVWDLSSEEIEFVYRERHMNNYVYAALRTFHDSPMPLNRKLSVRPGSVPACLQEPADRLLELSPYLGNDDPRNVRIHYTYRAFELFLALKEVKPQELDQALGLLAALAYIPIVAEKNDDFPLWWHTAVRSRDQHLDTLFDNVVEGRAIESYIEDCLWKEEGPEVRKKLRENPQYFALLFPPRVAQAIIVMSENGVETARIRQAWASLEREMVRFESEHGLRGPAARAGMTNNGQIRYRNTVYLYGGDFLRRQSDPAAFSWYTRDILVEGLPDLFGFYLTDMKTLERLLCAGALGEAGESPADLAVLISACHRAIFRNAATYAADTLAYVSGLPDSDLSAGRLTDPKSGRYRLYAGEASREVFFISLLHHLFVRRMEVRQIPYDRYFRSA